jgi:acyl-CoA synthetase (AMP-forming)/AMP-acid ligase II
MVSASFSHHIGLQLAKYGDSRSYIFLAGRIEDESRKKKLTYGALDRRARELAEWMLRSKLYRHPVLLLYPAGLEFLQAIIGCFYAGVIAVPAPLPTEQNSLRRLTGILEDTKSECILTTAAVADSLRSQLHEVRGDHEIRIVETDVQQLGFSEEWRMPEIDASTTALLQYTSGSSGEPKGVMVSHGNLLHNHSRIQEVLASNDGDVVTGWLPHFHDMGLLGLLVHPVYIGANCVFLSPTTFTMHRVRWLEAISFYRATITVAPDFAYELCSKTVSDARLEKLDLSTLRVALNGAEPIRHRTLERFTASFTKAGFKQEIFSPCYGMAEMTLLASGSDAGSSPVFCDVDPVALEHRGVRFSSESNALRLVSSGRFKQTDLQIVDPVERRIQPDGSIGEIWLRGGSVAQGYWGNPSATESVFRATTMDGKGPFLRSGDLGFTLDGELYITGRLKDLVIVNGRNLYPQDIESAIRDLHPSLESCSGAAFSISSDRDRVVVIQEVKEALLRDISLSELATRIKGILLRSFGVPSPLVLLTKRGTVKHTTSGKVQRQLMRTLFLDGSIEALHPHVLHDSIAPEAVQL